MLYTDRNRSDCQYLLKLLAGGSKD